MRKLQLNEDVYDIPGTWNELTTEQLCYLIRLVNKLLSAEEIKLKMLLYCMRACVKTYIPTDEGMLFRIKTGKKKYDLSAEELAICADLFAYLFITENDSISINPLLTRNPFSELRIKRKIFIGADEGLSSITYGQFVMLMTRFQEMQLRPEAINDFIAVIYTSEKRECTAALIAQLSIEIKTAILWYYLGSMQFITEKFPITFSGSGGSSSSVFESQMRVIDALANNDVTKKEIVKNALLYDALYSLEIAAENTEKMKN
jgi:hypothetical protein